MDWALHSITHNPQPAQLSEGASQQPNQTKWNKFPFFLFCELASKIKRYYNSMLKVISWYKIILNFGLVKAKWRVDFVNEMTFKPRKANQSTQLLFSLRMGKEDWVWFAGRSSGTKANSNWMEMKLRIVCRGVLGWMKSISFSLFGGLRAVAPPVLRKERENKRNWLIPIQQNKKRERRLIEEESKLMEWN